jgi:thiamine phosphate synthase YjbQ (UPF0047 family)
MSAHRNRFVVNGEVHLGTWQQIILCEPSSRASPGD